MKNFLIIMLLILALFLVADDSMVWIEAVPDTIYYDDNVTYSIITVMVENENQEPVEGAYITFGCSIGNMITSVVTNEDGIASTDFWESGDLGLAIINAARNGQVLTTNVMILPLLDSQDGEISGVINEVKIYPNPFNPITNLSFSLVETTEVTIDIFNSKGQKIEQILNETFTSGIHEVSWDAGEKRASGIYFAKVAMGNEVKMMRMILLK